MLQSQELEILVQSEYRLLDLPAVTRRAQQAREIDLSRDATADVDHDTPLRRLRKALARVTAQQATSRTTAGRI